MNLPVPTLLLAAVWVSGCATKPAPAFLPLADAPLDGSVQAGCTGHRQGEKRGATHRNPGPTLTGRVAVYNEAGRFVVLDFPIGHLPANEEVMFVFRQGLKVGEVKVTGPQRIITRWPTWFQAKPAKATRSGIGSRLAAEVGRIRPVRPLFQLQEVLHDHPSVLREDAFRMKLDAPDGKLLALYAHDFAFLRFGGDFQAVGD